MNYWLDLFTGTTWRGFREAGANVSGFRASQVKTAKRMQAGDIFLCYLTGVMRWVPTVTTLFLSTNAETGKKPTNWLDITAFSRKIEATSATWGCFVAKKFATTARSEAKRTPEFGC
jgi:hypothetical protein